MYVCLISPTRWHDMFQGQGCALYTHSFQIQSLEKALPKESVKNYFTKQQHEINNIPGV